MSEFLRLLVGRIRGYADDRRHARRRNVRLLVSVSVLEASRTNGKRPISGLEGYTADISTTGLSLVLPAIRIGEHYLTGENRTLLIALELPSGSVQIQATSVRYESIDGDGSENGYIVGVRIREMSDDHRERFTSYLKAR